MPNYIVNTRVDDNGYHEVHTSHCGHLPDSQNQRWVGSFDTCRLALKAAEGLGYSPADGCGFCSPDCHHDGK